MHEYENIDKKTKYSKNIIHEITLKFVYMVTKMQPFSKGALYMFWLHLLGAEMSSTFFYTVRSTLETHFSCSNTEASAGSQSLHFYWLCCCFGKEKGWKSLFKTNESWCGISALTGILFFFS